MDLCDFLISDTTNKVTMLTIKIVPSSELKYATVCVYNQLVSQYRD